MTKRIACLIGLALFATLSASAQTRRVEVNVPFSFAAAGTNWAAGTYEIDIRMDNGLATLNSRQSVSRMFLTNAGQSPDNRNMRVRFQRYGNQWVLRAIVGDGMQADVRPGKLERELMSQKPSDNRTLLAHVER